MRVLLLLAVLAMVSLYLVAAVPVPDWKSCASSDYDVNITDLEANVWPPQKGKDLIVNITGVNSKNITSGTYEIAIKCDGIPLPSIDGDIDTFHALPWLVGNLSFTWTQAIPSAAPSGKYTLKVSAVDQDKHGIFCLTVQTTIKSEAEAEVQGGVSSVLKSVSEAKQTIGGLLRNSRLGKPAKVAAMQKMKRRM